ncbi:Anxa6 [Symbiodinium sp. CCMP2456]|nr:Anxa6 [Symbiodinium sp. CCMP2456]
MGCCGSSDPPYNPHFRAQQGDPVRPKDAGFLPFVRWDTAAVAPQIKGGDHIYLIFTYSEAAIEGNEDGTVTAEVPAIPSKWPWAWLGGGSTEADRQEFRGSCIFRVWRKDGTNSVVQDGDDVFFEHVDTGKYLEASTDTEPLALTDKDDNASGQLWCFFKQGRPMEMRHRDNVYIQSWLHNYVEYRYFEDSNLYAKRWQRREPQTLTVLKKAVLDSSTTEVARKFQFQAFDLDGNGSISKREMDIMVRLVRGVEPSLEEIDGIMVKADPAHTGHIPFPSFASWADAGGMTEEELNHAEVLGNVAQRCFDALHEGRCLVEVLGTIDSMTVQGMVSKYSESLKAGNVSERIVEKAAESDGWLFSGNWKNCMKALLEPEVDLWVRCLNDAMQGLGTDENSLSALVCTLPERLRMAIFQQYQETFGKGLLEHIESETSFSYQKVMTWQAMAPEDCRARILNKAMAGLGTAEDQLIRVICQLNFGERREVKEAYQRKYDRDLLEHIQSETSGDFQKALLCMLEAEETAFDLEADCAAMKEAMEGWGTDEMALTKMICSKTAKQMEDVNNKFQELYERDLLEWVKSETSGYYQDTLLGCIRHPMKQLAHSVRDCMKGWGTDDEGLITCLVHLEDFKKAALIKEYSLEFGRDIFEDIKADTSGDYEKALCDLIKPAPQVWAEALTGAMKGMGTSDSLLINFMVLAKDDMMEVRKHFHGQNGQMLEEWIESECTGDYKETLMMLAGRNSEETISIAPVYWAQRCKDAPFSVETLKEVLVSMPATAIKRHTELYEAVYGASLKEEVEKKCNEKGTFFFFTNWWKHAMLSLTSLPVELYVKGLWDAMHGWGTDEYTLTALVCTLPENLYDEIHGLYLKTHERTLVNHIESETSFNYKKLLKYQAMTWAESRATALHGAMAGWGTSEDQLVRIIMCSTFKQRAVIREAYERLFGRDLIQHIESETSGNLKSILVAVLKCTHPKASLDYDKDCDDLKKAMDGFGTNEKAIIQIVAGKTPQQIETLKAKFEEKFGDELFTRIDSETWDCGQCMFMTPNFRACMLGLLREPTVRHACAVRDCILGWGTDDTGLLTLLVHLSERQRRDLAEAYKRLTGSTIFDAIEGDTSGDFKQALMALVKPAPKVWAEAILSSMKGLGTSDNLLINWMCIAKERMDEVKDFFSELEPRGLPTWIAEECGDNDYKDTLLRLANRKCERFSGQEVGLSISPPESKEQAILQFTMTFNRLCKMRREKGDNIIPTEEHQQAMGNAFLYYGSMSSCAPNLDIPGVWELTNACGFPPADDGPDLVATFHEWDVSGTGEITWNDFVREMTARINDPGHFNSDPLPETIGMISIPDRPRADGYKSHISSFNASDDDYESFDSDTPQVDMYAAFTDGSWKDVLAGVEPGTDGAGHLAGPWGECIAAAVKVECTEEWQDRFPDAPVGVVIEYMCSCGHEGFVGPAEQKEQESGSKVFWSYLSSYWKYELALIQYSVGVETDRVLTPTALIRTLCADQDMCGISSQQHEDAMFGSQSAVLRVLAELNMHMISKTGGEGSYIYNESCQLRTELLTDLQGLEKMRSQLRNMSKVWCENYGDHLNAFKKTHETAGSVTEFDLSLDNMSFRFGDEWPLEGWHYFWLMQA